jgi:vitamin B12 transporter
MFLHISRAACKFLAVILSLNILLWAGLGHASEAPGNIEEGNEESGGDHIVELVVAASRLPTELAKLSNSVTVLSQEKIDRRNAASVIDLLRGIEGVQIAQPGGRGGVTSLYLRGGEANFSSVFVDGVKVNNPNNTRGGSFDFATLSTANIERVEIIRGPQSAIYGSDALSGVVNFISNQSRENELNVKLEIGEEEYSRKLIRGNIRVSENHQISLGAGTTEDHNNEAESDFELTSFWTRMQGESDDGSTQYRLNINSADAEQSSFPEDSGGARFAAMRSLDEGKSKDLQASLSVEKKWSAAWDSQLLLTHYERDEFTDSPGVVSGVRDGVPANSFDSNLKRRYLQIANRYRQDNFSISFGSDLQTEEASSFGELQLAPGFALPSSYSVDRDIAGVFADGSIELSDSFNLLASLRYDDPDAADSRFSPSLGVISRLANDKTMIKANWSKGFKLPSFFALASPLVGNPELLEEQVTSFDLEISHRFSTEFLLRMALFDSDYKDLIDFDSEAFINVNRSEVTIRGAEMAVDMVVSERLSISAFASYNDIDVISSGQLRQRPDWQGGFELNYAASEQSQVYARASRLGDNFDSSIPTGDQTLNAYTRVDLAASWQVSEQLRFDAAIDNLLDKEHFEAIGFPATGRRARLALDWKL